MTVYKDYVSFSLGQQSTSTRSRLNTFDSAVSFSTEMKIILVQDLLDSPRQVDLFIVIVSLQAVFLCYFAVAASTPAEESPVTLSDPGAPAALTAEQDDGEAVDEKSLAESGNPSDLEANPFFLKFYEKKAAKYLKKCQEKGGCRYGHYNN